MPVIPREALTFQQLDGRSSADPLAGDLATALTPEPGCSVRVVRVAPGARTPHRHPSSAEVVYVADGEGVAWEDGLRTTVRTGDLIVVPRGTAHATAAAAAGLVLICFFPAPAVGTEELATPLVDP